MRTLHCPCHGLGIKEAAQCPGISVSALERDSDGHINGVPCVPASEKEQIAQALTEMIRWAENTTRCIHCVGQPAWGDEGRVAAIEHARVTLARSVK